MSDLVASCHSEGVAELRTAVAIGAAAAAFAVGAVVASGLSGDGAHSPAAAASTDVPLDPPAVGEYANGWHRQTVVASYESRLLRYAQQHESFTGARFAFRSRSFILYAAGPPPMVVRRLLADPPANADVSWVQVPYSRAQLDDAVHALRRAMPVRSVVEYAPNFSGILVGLHPLPTSRGRQAALYSRAQTATDVPVTFLQAGFADPM
jgi:hypothetical protein